MKRRKGVAIVETNKGFLVVSGKSKKFVLPGGGANKNESRKKATIRELYEETNLKTKTIKYLFKHAGKKWRGFGGKLFTNHTKVFLITTKGIPKSKNEIKQISYWNNQSDLSISSGTKNILEKYLKYFKK